jgi:hypothetical protein
MSPRPDFWEMAKKGMEGRLLLLFGALMGGMKIFLKWELCLFFGLCGWFFVCDEVR